MIIIIVHHIVKMEDANEDLFEGCMTLNTINPCDGSAVSLDSTLQDLNEASDVIGEGRVDLNDHGDQTSTPANALQPRKNMQSLWVSHTDEQTS